MSISLHRFHSQLWIKVETGFIVEQVFSACPGPGRLPGYSGGAILTSNMAGQNGTIRGTGIDIVSVPRMRRAVQRFGDRLVMRILGPQELVLYRERHNRIEYLAGRFAAKEAIIKALAGVLAVRPAFTHLQIVNDAQGQPVFRPTDGLARSLASVTVLISIAHERTHAVATALIQVKQ